MWFITSHFVTVSKFWHRGVGGGSYPAGRPTIGVSRAYYIIQLHTRDRTPIFRQKLFWQKVRHPHATTSISKSCFFKFCLVFFCFLALKWPTRWCQNWVRHKVRQSEAPPVCDVDFFNFFLLNFLVFFSSRQGKIGGVLEHFLGWVKVRLTRAETSILEMSKKSTFSTG